MTESALGRQSAPATAEAMGRDRQSGDYRIAPRTVATIATGCSVAFLTALAVLAGVKGTDVLSTVALAVAITSFVLQVLISVAQNSASNEAIRRSEELSTETRTLLAEIGSAAKQTQVLVGEQLALLLKTNSDMMQQALAAGDVRHEDSAEHPKAEASPAPARTGPDPAAQLEFVERTQALLERIGATSGTQGVGDTIAARLRENRESTARLAAILETYPGEAQGLVAVQALGPLSTAACRRLRELARDVKEMATLGGTVGIAAQERDPVLNELRDARLIETFGGEVLAPGEVWQRLTDDGREAARVLVAPGPPPTWAAELHDRGL